MPPKKTFPFLLLIFELAYTVLILRLTFPLIQAHDTDAALAWLGSLIFILLGVYFFKANGKERENRAELLIIPLGVLLLSYTIFGILHFDRQAVKNENFVWYAEEGRMEKVKALLEEKSFTQTVLEEAMTAAIRADKPETMEILAAKGCPLDYSSAPYNPKVFFHYAAKNKALRALEELLRLGVDINIPDPEEGKTVLHLFFQEKWQDPALLALLLEKGADPNKGDNKGDTPLHYAARYYAPREELEKLLFYKGEINKLNKYYQPPLFMAGSTKWEELLQDLGARDIPTHERAKETDLHIAAAEGDINGIEKLLDQGNIPLDRGNADGWSPLYYAVEQNQIQAVRTLINHGASVNVGDIWNQTPLMIACESAENNKILTLLLDKGADPSRLSYEGLSAMTLAIHNEKNISGAGLLTSYGAQADYQSLSYVLDNMPETGRYYNQLYGEKSEEASEAVNEYKKTLDQLWDHPMELLEQEWESLLALALFRGDWECIMKAIGNGAKLSPQMLENVYKTDNSLLLRRLYDNFPEIHSAFTTQKQLNELLYRRLRFQNLTCASFILELGADINYRDFNSNTPLHRIILDSPYAEGDEQQKGDRLSSITQFLIENGADLTARNTEDLTPEECAKDLNLDGKIIGILAQ